MKNTKHTEKPTITNTTKIMTVQSPHDDLTAAAAAISRPILEH